MKDRPSLKLLQLLTRISYWGSLLIITLIIIFGVVVLSGKAQEVKLGFPASLSQEREITYLQQTASIPVEVEFEAASIEIPVKYLKKTSIAWIISSTVIVLVCIAYISFQFKEFMNRVLAGQTFHAPTIQLLRKAALGFLALEFLGFLAEMVGYFSVKQSFVVDDFDHPFSVSFPSLPIILALILWVLAHIFTKGKELEDEQKLTV